MQTNIHTILKLDEKDISYENGVTVIINELSSLH